MHGTETTTGTHLRVRGTRLAPSSLGVREPTWWVPSQSEVLGAGRQGTDTHSNEQSHPGRVKQHVPAFGGGSAGTHLAMSSLGVRCANSCEALLLDLVPVAHPANAFFYLFGLVFVEVVARDTLKPFFHDGFARLGRRLPTITAASFA